MHQMFYENFGFKITEDRKVDQGFYVNFKLGGKFPGGVAGVEGDLKVMFTSRAETDVEAHTWFKGSEKREGDGPFVDKFKVYGYWLKGDNSGYWVPEYRRPYGDEPWFVTYRISNYLPFIVPEP